MVYKIYKVTNLINGKIYIGQTHYENPRYFGSGSLIMQAINKYGIENFVKEYIDEAFSQEELDAKEIYWIKELNSQDLSIGYNIADGGWNMFTMNDEIKKKISNTLKGKYVGKNSFRYGYTLSKIHKQKISDSNRGKIFTEEHRRKISDAKKGMGGDKISEETRKKISEANTGKKLSEEHKRKISESGKNKVWTIEQKEKLRNSNINKTQIHSRTVYAICALDNNEFYFNNVSEAARYFNTTRHRIKNNLIKDWSFTVNDPIISIKILKKPKDGSESKINT